MDVHTLVFQGKEISIYGSYNEPLFPAIEVATIMGIRNPNAAAQGVASFKRKVLNIKNKEGVEIPTIMVTPYGVSELSYKTQKAIAGAFDKWVIETALPELQKRAQKVDKCEPIQAQKENKCEDKCEQVQPQEEIEQVPDPGYETTPVEEPIEEHAILSLPMIKSGGENRLIGVPNYVGDINEFADNPVVYLLYIRPTRPDQDQYDYKFGQTGDIYERLSCHASDFKRREYIIEPVKIWNCATMGVMQKVEKQIKILARSLGILVSKYGKQEIITTEDIEPVISRIDRYVEQQNVISCRPHEISSKHLDIELRSIDEKIKSHELEMAKLANIEGQRERNRELELLIIMKKLELGITL